MVISNDDKLKVEAIKLAVGSTAYMGFSVSSVYEEAVERLKQYYEETKETVYLEAALLHIHAYMEIGCVYEDKKELFDYILKQLNLEKNIEFPQKYYEPSKIKLSKSQIRSKILKWPASKQRQNINEVVEDIFNKVANKEVGVYYYDSNPTPDVPGTSGDLYELLVGEAECIFHDIKRRKYFTFAG